MSKITRRSYKRKKIIMGAVLFAAVGLVSTGFAAWVLSAPAEAEKNASLKVGQISDKSMEFGAVSIYKTNDENKVEDADFHFEPLATDVSGRVRYDGENAQSLSLTVESTLTHTENCGEILGILSAGTRAGDLQTAIDKGYIVAPETFSESDITLWNKDGDGSLYFASSQSDPGSDGVVMSFRYIVEFKWGSFFNGDNPGIFFDSGDAVTDFLVGDPEDTLALCESESRAPTVAAILNDLHDLLDGIDLTLTLTANPN